MLKKNQRFIAEIIDLTAEGNGVCRIDDIVVFVPATAIGDKIRLKIVKVLKNYAYGISEEILISSPFRVNPDCEIFQKCGGCIFRHITYDSECKVKNEIVKNAFTRIGGLNPEFEAFMPCEEIYHYRNKAQYPLTNINNKIVCGFYAPRSHRLFPITNCALQPEIFSDILGMILEYLNSNNISVYDEISHSGILRHIYVRQGAHSGEIMICFVVRKACNNQLIPLSEKLIENFKNVKSIIMNINSEKTNVILGKKCIKLLGNDVITDIMCGNKIEISPLSFYQVNTQQAECLYSKALEYIAPNKSDIVADLYCGAGTIGLYMAKYVKRVIGVEIIPEAVENAKRNAQINSISNAKFYCGDAGKIFAELNKNGYSPNKIIIDPPRKGCSVEALEVMRNASPEKIVMISCNPSTAARDTAWLVKNGYNVEKVCGVDMFPRTGHIECVVLMTKNKMR